MEMNDAAAADPRPDLYAAVRSVVGELTGLEPAVEQIGPDTALTDLGINSLLLFPFLTALEKAAGATIADDAFEAAKLSTVGAVCAALGR